MTGDLTRRAFLRRAATLLAACGAGPRASPVALGGVMPPPPTPPPPPPPAPPPPSPASTQPVPPLLIGYGVVNHWHRVNAGRLAYLLATSGLTLTEIEYVPWFDESGPGGRSARTNVAAAARFVEAMRAEGIVTFVNVVNWNGAAQRCEDDAWFRDRVIEIREVVGVDRVVLQGVSEPRSTKGDCPDHFDKADRWQRIAREEWPGLFVVYGTWPGPRPATVDIPYDYLDLHYCSFAPMVDLMAQGELDRIHNTDCTPLVAGNLGAERAARLTRQALRFGTNLLVYDFDRGRIDEAMIAAMGAELRP